MPNQGDEIYNPRTGQRMIFLLTGKETNGELLQIESFNKPHSPAEPEHVHPYQVSSCKVISGTLKFFLNGKEKLVKPGETLTIPAGVPHFFLNDGDAVAHAIQEFRPALTIDGFFEFYFSLSSEGKLDKKGKPGFLQMMVALKTYDKDIRVTKPPRVLQLISMNILAPVGRMMGYKSKYNYYKGKNNNENAGENFR